MLRHFAQRTCECWPPTVFQKQYFSGFSQVKCNVYKPKVRDNKARDSTKARKVNLSNKLRTEFAKFKGQTPIIQCKRMEFNFYEGMKYNKFKPFPLASSAWLNRHSNGDYFILYNKYMSPDDLHFKNIPHERRSSNILDTVDADAGFSILGVEDQFMSNLKKMGVTKPADIQVASIPKILKGKNCVVSAHTGCGKTLAFLLPLLQMVLRETEKEGVINIPHNSPKAIILTPSRELACQIFDVMQQLGHGLPLSHKLVVGGNYNNNSRDSLPEIVDIVVASLGTFKKQIAKGVMSLERVKYVVLDEADQLVDDQNRFHVREILKKVNIKQDLTEDEEKPGSTSLGAQITLVSATLPTNLQSLFKDLVDVSSFEKINTAFLHNVLKSAPQLFMKVSKIHKGKTLIDLVEKDIKNKNPVLIFSNTLKTADWVSIQLNESGFPCKNLTSSIPVEVRQHLFKRFQKGEFNILSTTPMAARGLDTVRVKHLINFDMPLYVSEYIHQIGRVGRIGSPKSCSITNIIAHPREVELVQKIETSVRLYEKLVAVSANIPGILKHRRERTENDEEE